MDFAGSRDDSTVSCVTIFNNSTIEAYVRQNYKKKKKYNQHTKKIYLIIQAWIFTKETPRNICSISVLVFDFVDAYQLLVTWRLYKKITCRFWQTIQLIGLATYVFVIDVWFFSLAVLRLESFINILTIQAKIKHFKSPLRKHWIE